MIGSLLDHAIALTCYLLALNIESWLLLGFGLPHGSTAYVFTREYTKELQTPIHYIYDVYCATKYNVQDANCPLQKIFCLINERNVMILCSWLNFVTILLLLKIWANIQRNDSVSGIRFDLTRKSDWSTLFNARTQVPCNTPQLKLNYVYENDVQELEIKIDKKIRKKIMKLRKLKRTVWNHSVSSVYKSAMKKLEINSLHSKSNMDTYMEVNKATSNVEVLKHVQNIV